MNDYRNNPVSLASTRQRAVSPDRAVFAGPSPRGRVALAGSSSGPRMSQGAEEGAGRVYTHRMQQADRPRSGSSGRGVPGGQGADGRRSRSAGERGESGSSKRSTNFMKYAADSRAVQAIHTVTSGSLRPVFIAVVAVAVAVGLYFPIRDYYTAWRTGEILSQQVALRDSYNEGLQENVDRYLSQEGIEEAARSELGMVLPGETRIELTGTDGSTDQDGDSSDADADAATGDGADQDSSDGESTGDASQDVPSTSAEAEKAEAAVAEQAPWYIEMLDTIFFYEGVEGQTVTSAGGE